MLKTLPESFTSRSATMDDIDAVVALLNACAIEETGHPQFRADELRTDWQRPGFNLETDTLVVLAPDGEFVGYAVTWDFEPHVHIMVTAAVHPERKKLGIGTALCHWIEARGQQSVPKAPPDTRVTLSQEVLSGNEAAQELLCEQGYQFAHYSLHMLIKMDGAPPEPVAPDGFTIRPFVRGQEERAMIQAIRESFRGHWGYVEGPFEDDLEGYVHLLDTPGNDPSHWFVVMDEDEIAGTSFCYTELAEDPEMGWIWALGVRPPWRRRGLALALLQHCFYALYQHGKHKVGLAMDAQNLSATRLYEKAGMHTQRQYKIYESELRPGDEPGGSLEKVEEESDGPT
ncbi:MAG: GNAT family N-acetyltransferase [Chloroflexi bacterium]|nr:GNAT family N-acetyltransferase [Chloroflexota bacterium]